MAAPAQGASGRRTTRMPPPPRAQRASGRRATHAPVRARSGSERERRATRTLAQGANATCNSFLGFCTAPPPALAGSYAAAVLVFFCTRFRASSGSQRVLVPPSECSETAGHSRDSTFARAVGSTQPPTAVLTGKWNGGRESQVDEPVPGLWRC